MSRIQRPGSIGDIIKVLSDDSVSSSTKAPAQDNASATTTSKAKSSSKDPVAHLKTDITQAIQALSLDEPEQKESARKILISKIIQWHFKSIIRNSAQKAYLTETVNKTIRADESANQQLETLLQKLAS